MQFISLLFVYHPFNITPKQEQTALVSRIKNNRSNLIKCLKMTKLKFKMLKFKAFKRLCFKIF